MDQNALVIEEIDAGENLVCRLSTRFPIQVAFWLKEAHDDARWSLYLASNHVNQANRDRVFRDILRICRESANPYLDPFQVNVIATSDPIAEVAFGFRQRFSGDLPIRYGGSKFGGIDVDGVYIYPSLDPVAAT